MDIYSIDYINDMIRLESKYIVDYIRRNTNKYKMYYTYIYRLLYIVIYI